MPGLLQHVFCIVLDQKPGCSAQRLSDLFDERRAQQNPSSCIRVFHQGLLFCSSCFDYKCLLSHHFSQSQLKNLIPPARTRVRSRADLLGDIVWTWPTLQSSYFLKCATLAFASHGPAHNMKHTHICNGMTYLKRIHTHAVYRMPAGIT